MDGNENEFPLPAIHPHKRGRFSAVWIIPILAIVAAGTLAIRTYLRIGPSIYITFNNAEGIEAGKTQVRFKNVPVGKVTAVNISSDHNRVVVSVELTKGAAGLAVSDTKFWVERPRIGVGGVSGLGTLLSGAFIQVDVGKSTSDEDTFLGLEKPPGVMHDQQGRRFRLTASDSGSLSAQSPIYLRRQQVGTITSLALAPDGKSVEIDLFVYAPYDRFVVEKTVFWNASGLDVTLDATGLRVNTQSLATVIAGGVAFGVRDPDVSSNPAAEGTKFALFEDRSRAFAIPDLDVGGYPLAMRFHEPIRGLGKGVGVNIELEGLHIGDVIAVRPGYDSATRSFFFDVDAKVFPQRLGAAYASLVEEGARSGKTGPQMLDVLVTRGLRAQLRSANILTGSFYIALDWFPTDRVKASLPPHQDDVWVVPTVRGGTEQIQDTVASILAKVDKIPFDAIGADVRGASRAAATLLGNLDRDIMPEARALFVRAGGAMEALREGLTSLRDNIAAPDSALQESARTTLEQLERAAFSLRGLADYIQRHPESLVRGRPSGRQPKSK
ncbi:MAG: MlaD family protein [Myxococcota bacterium]|nr:MCE family protein [Deltaproteobacteria bacterium]MDQ3335706.1 MlaD family protein [Myxococcota bacterium]